MLQTRLQLARRSAHKPFAEGQDSERRGEGLQAAGAATTWPRSCCSRSRKKVAKLLVDDKALGPSRVVGGCLFACSRRLNFSSRKLYQVVTARCGSARGRPLGWVPIPTAHLARHGRSVGPWSAILCKRKHGGRILTAHARPRHPGSLSGGWGVWPLRARPKPF